MGVSKLVFLARAESLLTISIPIMCQAQLLQPDCTSVMAAALLAADGVQAGPNAVKDGLRMLDSLNRGVRERSPQYSYCNY